jgi:hypothetical protein
VYLIACTIRTYNREIAYWIRNVCSPCAGHNTFPACIIVGPLCHSSFVTHTHTHARTHARTRTHARAHTRTHTRTHARTHTCAHTHMSAYTRTHTRTHMHTLARTRTHAHTLTHTRGSHSSLFFGQWRLLKPNVYVSWVSKPCWIGLSSSSSVKLRDFTVWHTWRKKWVNCTVLIGNSAVFRTVLSSRLSDRELRVSPRESHTHIQFSFSCSFLRS